MSSFLCFICHSTVNADTNEEMREKYRDVVGMNLCPDSHLCYICCHVMNRLWLFRSVCLKRSLEYPVLFSEKGTLNLQRNDLEIHSVCFEDCDHYKSRNINTKFYHFTYYDGIFDNNEKYNLPNEYVELEDERQEFDDLGNNNVNYNCNNDVQNDEFNDNFNFNDTESHEEVEGNEFMVETEGHDANETQGKDKNDQDELLDDLDQEYGENCYEDDQNYASDERVNYDEDAMPADPKSAPTSEVNTETHATDMKEEPKSPLNTESNIGTGEVASENRKKKKKKKKHKIEKDRNKFDKFLLSVEQQKGDLEVKRKEKKYIEAEFKCYNCAIGFLFKDTYQTHMMRHEESNGEYLCQICSLRFATTAVLRAHTALHAERHRCLRCGASVRRRHRVGHAAECHGASVESAACHLCGRVFKDSKALQQHLKRFHHARSSGRTYPCGVCGERCRDQAAVRTHMLKHIQRRFACDLCPRTFGTPHTRRAHRAAHDQPRTRRETRRRQREPPASYPCESCGRVCASSSSLRAHVSARHSALTLPCASCGAKLASRRQLARHERTHRPRETLVALCHLCGGSFTGNSKLNRHLREVCEKDKLEEELSSYYAQAENAEC